MGTPVVPPAPEPQATLEDLSNFQISPLGSPFVSNKKSNTGQLWPIWPNVDTPLPGSMTSDHPMEPSVRPLVLGTSIGIGNQIQIPKFIFGEAILQPQNTKNGVNVANLAHFGPPSRCGVPKPTGGGPEGTPRHHTFD